MIRSLDSPTLPAITALSEDISRNPDYHKSQWILFAKTRPGFSDFINRRLIDLFGPDEVGASKALALFVEVESLDQRLAQAELMSKSLGFESSYDFLADLSPKDQLSALPAEPEQTSVAVI